jgi:hypothetical protein
MKNSLEIPDGWFVGDAYFDAPEPYIVIVNDKYWDKKEKIKVPEALAYYLSTHYSGSQKMREEILEKGRLEVINNIKKILRLD